MNIFVLGTERVKRVRIRSNDNAIAAISSSGAYLGGGKLGHGPPFGSPG